VGEVRAVNGGGVRACRPPGGRGGRGSTWSRGCPCRP
jgi:hypothetical protein